MKGIILLLGTNVGDRHANLKLACEKIENSNIVIISRSSIYETEPWGFKSQQAFYNQAINIRSRFNPFQLLEKLQLIEKEMGRVKNHLYGPRVIDIDILLFDNQVVKTEKLIIPHPHMHKRKFTLVPANEIGSDIIHPISGSTISKLLDRCIENERVIRID